MVISVKKVLLASVIAWLLLSAGLLAHAQRADNDDERSWTIPRNLSRSGAAWSPLAVSDSNDRLHVLWRDSFDGFVYSTGDGTDWIPPIAVELPFGTRSYFPDLQPNELTPRFAPQLIASPAGQIHALWLDDSQQDATVLYSSSVAWNSFAQFDSWQPRQPLANAVAGFYGTFDSGNYMQIVYIQTGHAQESPAGVYYRRFDAENQTWSDPIAIYESVYFRSLPPDEAIAMIVDQGNGRLALAWDEPYLGKIMMAQSTDNGFSWSEPRDVTTVGISEQDTVSPQAPSPTGRPTLIALAPTWDGALYLVWRESDVESCSTYLQSFDSGGTGWLAPHLIPLSDCAPVIEIMPVAGGALLHAGNAQGQVLFAWDGDNWSEPYNLPVKFDDPDTGRPVSLDCLQMNLVDGSRLRAVGCDQAGGNDVWLLAQDDSAGTHALFVTPTPRPTSIWSTPVHVPAGQSGVRQDVQRIAITTDVKGRFHLVWSQPAQNALDGPGRALSYTRWDLETSQQDPRSIILFAPPDEIAETPALASDTDGRLHLVWRGGEAGTIMYSRVMADLALHDTNWADPQPLSLHNQSASWPVVVVGPDDSIHVAYAVALNERRGIYHTRSDDGGKSWREPVAVVDAAGKDWAMVDHPALAIGHDGTIHIAWSSLPLPHTLLSGGIYYSHASDGDNRWSEPHLIADGQVDWPQIVAIGELEVHVAWREMADRALVRHTWSADKGLAWFRSDLVPGTEGVQGPAGLALDGAGRVHAIALVDTATYAGSLSEASSSWALQHRVRDNEQWLQAGNGAAIVPESVRPDLLVFGIAGGDRLGLVVANTVIQPTLADADPGERLTLLNRPLELPAVRPTPLPTLTPQPTSSPQPLPSPTAVPSPTPNLSGDNAAVLRLGPVSLNSNWAGLTLGAAGASLIVILTFVVGAVSVRRRRR